MSATSDPIVIVSAVRSPFGRFLGDLTPVQATALGAHVTRSALERARLPVDRQDEVLMGYRRGKGRLQRSRRRAAQAFRTRLARPPSTRYAGPV
jgi:acetyl-CoA C-acetyltransferase